jgi:NitT/TauT family transport system permease protein
MRYTHSIVTIRKRKNVLTISIIFTIFLLAIILTLGFTALNAQQFFLGFILSLLRVSVAYIISLILALLIALFVFSSNKIEAISLPVLDVLQSFPSFALFPLFVVWFGRTAIVTILILIIAMIWPILFTLITAQKQLRQDLIEAAKMFGATGNKYILYVLLPLLFPAIITGSIVSWGEAWEAIIAAEIIIAIPGVGTYLAISASNNQTHILIIGILLLLLILFILNKYIWLPLLNISTKYQQE